MVNELPTSPAAKVVLDGLFVTCLKAEENGQRIAPVLEAGVYELADQHDFSLRITKRNRATDELIGEALVLNPSPRSPYLGDIEIYVENGTRGVQLYQNPNLEDEVFRADPATLGDVDPNAEDVKHDFRWVIDLEGKRFFNRMLPMLPGSLPRRIRILDGVASSYDVGPREVRFVFPVAAALAQRKLTLERCYVATQMQVELEASATARQQIIISYADSATSQQRNRIVLLPDANFYYEIRLYNNCPETNKQGRRTSDFQHYYNVFTTVPADERIDFALYVAGGGNYETPCDIVYGGGHPGGMGWP